MQSADLRIDAGWIVPIEPHGALRDHALVIDAGRIVAVMPFADADRAVDARERVALLDHVVLPGLVNAHTHAAMSLFRGLADDVSLKVWLEQQIWPREGQFVSPDFVYDGARLAAAEMLRGGDRCNDITFFPMPALVRSSSSGCARCSACRFSTFRPRMLRRRRLSANGTRHSRVEARTRPAFRSRRTRPTR
jgi:5-methylthioadenosine/S-adenosylhomocysteine deaminase